jgi:L-ascorbate metabolism protein UlaG (beta-lactamase superfamily)
MYNLHPPISILWHLLSSHLCTIKSSYLYLTKSLEQMKKNILGVTFTLLSGIASAQTSIQLIRSATLVVHYNGQKILVDPMFSEKGAFRSFAGIEKNPTVDLKVPVAEITNELDLVLVTHIHPDHFDDAASNLLDKSVTLFHQPADVDYFKEQGFKNAKPISNHTVWNGIEITRVDAQHGSGAVLNYTGHASGYILKAKGQPTLYIVGDGIWTDEVKKNIHTHKPDYIIVNAGGASLPSLNSGPIIMDAEQTLSLINESGDAKVIAVHMEALDHCSTTRTALREKAAEAKVPSDKLLIPLDGEIINIR